MTTDRTTKALLLAIAAGLWFNIIGGDFARPVAVKAQSLGDSLTFSRMVDLLKAIESDTSGMESSLNLIQRDTGRTAASLDALATDGALRRR